jgi:hypothetical protein
VVCCKASRTNERTNEHTHGHSERETEGESESALTCVSLRVPLAAAPAEIRRFTPPPAPPSPSSPSPQPPPLLPRVWRRRWTTQQVDSRRRNWPLRLSRDGSPIAFLAGASATDPTACYSAILDCPVNWWRPHLTLVGGWIFRTSFFSRAPLRIRWNWTFGRCCCDAIAWMFFSRPKLDGGALGSADSPLMSGGRGRRRGERGSNGFAGWSLHARAHGVLSGRRFRVGLGGAYLRSGLCPVLCCPVGPLVQLQECMMRLVRIGTGITRLNLQPVRLAYQPPASSTFLSEQTSYQQPDSSTFLSE